jgi:hypothetical protein
MTSFVKTSALRSEVEKFGDKVKLEIISLNHKETSEPLQFSSNSFPACTLSEHLIVCSGRAGHSSANVSVRPCTALTLCVALTLAQDADRKGSRVTRRREHKEEEEKAKPKKEPSRKPSKK